MEENTCNTEYTNRVQVFFLTIFSGNNIRKCNKKKIDFSLSEYMPIHRIGSEVNLKL